MGIFNKRKSLPREELQAEIRKNSGIIPHSGGKKYTYKERINMGKEVFGRKYGSQISKSDYKQALRGLKSLRNRTRNASEKKKIERKIDYLRNIGGIRG